VANSRTHPTEHLLLAHARQPAAAAAAGGGNVRGKDVSPIDRLFGACQALGLRRDRSIAAAQDMTRLSDREPTLYHKIMKMLALSSFVEIRNLQSDYRAHACTHVRRFWTLR
jgi:hypothetical protein